MEEKQTQQAVQVDFRKMLAEAFPNKAIVFIVEDGDTLAVCDVGFTGLVKRMGLLESARVISSAQMTEWVRLPAQTTAAPAPALAAVPAAGEA